jgi:tetratricopeptide (TPR) repeat protein
VEEALLQQPRSHDIPGGEAPERYWQFLRSGDPASLLDVVGHNQQDVLSLARVLDYLARHLELDEPLPSDWLSLGRFIEARGDLSGASGAYRRAERLSPPPLDRAAALRRARLLRRQGLEDEARQAWSAIWERWHDPEAAEAVCIDLEHRQRDPAAALELVREVLREAPAGWDQRFVRRMWRLQGRLGVSAMPAESTLGRELEVADSRPWSGWLPGGESYEAWLALRRGGRGATRSPGSIVGLAETAER